MGHDPCTGQALGPGDEAILQLHRVQPGEDIAEGVVGWNAVGQLQEALKPGQFALAEKLNMDPGIGAADGGADGDGRNVHRFVMSGTFHSGIVQLGEMIETRMVALGGCAMPSYLHDVQRIMVRQRISKNPIKTRLPWVI